MIDFNETIYVREAIYHMSYSELSSIVSFVCNFNTEDIPESIKEHLSEWEEFLTDNF